MHHLPDRGDRRTNAFVVEVLMVMFLPLFCLLNILIIDSVQTADEAFVSGHAIIRVQVVVEDSPNRNREFQVGNAVTGWVRGKTSDGLL